MKVVIVLMREVLRKPLRTPRERQQRLTPRFLRYSRAAMQQLVQMGVHLLELPPGEFRQFSDNVLWAHSLSMVAQAQASDKHAGEGLLIARPRDYATMGNQNKAESRNQKAKIRSTSPRPLVIILDLRDECLRLMFSCMDTCIIADPEHLGGSPRVRGTRISLSLILESLAAGMTVLEIVDAFPSLTEESVRGALSELAHEKELQPA